MTMWDNEARINSVRIQTKKWEKTLKEHYAEAELLKRNVLKF